MAPLSLLSHHLLLGLALGWGRIAVASPIQDSQQLLDSTHAHVQPRKLHGKFLHITDFHPDPFYKPHSSTQEGIACHRKSGPAGFYGAETTDCDSPFSLVNATFDWLEKNVKDEIDFIVWTGDSARHDSDERHPRNTHEVLDTNRKIANKFVETFSGPDGQLVVPVVPTFGNNDFLPHNIFYPGPNKWLRAYDSIWNRFIPEEQRHSFEFGGWFWVEVIPNHLAVFSLNTMYFFDRNAGVDGCADPREPGFHHMDWLRVQLQILRDRGMKAILTGHVPPARTDSKKNWDETCWQKYTLWLQQYRDVVTASLYGHMNIDHFLLQDTDELSFALAETDEDDARMSLGDDVTIESKQDYLQELREEWAKLPKSALKELSVAEAEGNDVDTEGKKRKKRKKKLRKIGGKYAERYILSLISPSIVPNYFPTIRVFEYNITGLEEQTAWTDTFDQSITLAPPDSWEIDEGGQGNQELRRRDVDSEGKKKKKKHKKPKKPKNPNFVVPEDPPKGSTPGPAYFPQPLTLTGYVQYFANLTYINNDVDHPNLESDKWRNGDFSDKQPEHGVPKPNEFSFEVEYSTFTDKVFRLKDLTVKNYLKLAYKISKNSKKGKGNKNSVENEVAEDEQAEMDPVLSGTDEEEFDDDEPSQYDDDNDTTQEDDGEDDAESQKKGKKKKKKKSNKTWVEFLTRAFVGTMSEKELNKL